ncbi:hypothetical protein [Sphingobium yanoikuyae]|uniref:hypothetical protein n=1 Tax=Sphingobium yanoikuyae TaxID=13690 RepID=UPI002FDA42B2
MHRRLIKRACLVRCDDGSGGFDPCNHDGAYLDDLKRGFDINRRFERIWKISPPPARLVHRQCDLGGTDLSSVGAAKALISTDLLEVKFTKLT